MSMSLSLGTGTVLLRPIILIFFIAILIGQALNSLQDSGAPTNDLAFKKVFGSKKNKHVLIDFLNAINAVDNTRITDVKNIRTDYQLLAPTKYEKSSSVDVYCKTSENVDIFIEVQAHNYDASYEKRIAFYSAKKFTEGHSKHDKFSELSPVVMVAVTKYNMFPHIPYPLTHHRVVCTETMKDFCFGSFSFVILQLPMFTKEEPSKLETDAEKWLYFLTHGSRTPRCASWESIINSSEALKAATETLDFNNWNTNELAKYWEIEELAERREAEFKGKYEEELVKRTEIAREEGRKEGREEMCVKLIKKFCKQGCTPSDIAQKLDITVSEVNQLMKKYNL